MNKNRLEAFSDAVIAIVLTIMVLELKVPHEADWMSLQPLLPVFLSYVLSFIYLGIYWNNHHHLLQTIKTVNGRLLWANLHLLFWLSLIPFTSAWMGEHPLDSFPVALYGLILLMAAIAYFILQKVIVKIQGEDSVLAKVLGKDIKGKMSPLIYLLALLFAFVQPWVSNLLYLGVALMWLVPDQRIEKGLKKINLQA